MKTQILCLGACVLLMGCQSVDAPPIGLSSPVGLTASDCVIVPRDTWLGRTVSEGSPNSPAAVDIYIGSVTSSSRVPNLTLENYWCRFDNARQTYAARAGRAHDILVAQNALTFGAGAYIGSTLALNSSGLNDTQTDDLLETAVGIGLLSASRSLFNPMERRTRYRNASLAAICYMSHIDMAYNRQQNLTEMDDTVETLAAGIATAQQSLSELASLMADNQDRLQTALEQVTAGNDADRNNGFTAEEAALLSTALPRVLEVQQASQQAVTDAQAALTEARTTLALARQQQVAASQFQRTLREDALHFPVLVQHSVQSGQLDLQTVLQAINDVVESARDFTDPEQEVEPAPEITGVEKDDGGRESGSDAALVTQLADVQAKLAELTAQLEEVETLRQALGPLIPNYSTLTTSLRACRTVLMTGQRIEPDLSDRPLGPDDAAFLMETLATGRASAGR